MRMAAPAPRRGSIVPAAMLAALVVLVASVALAFSFPPLAGRVTDQANIIPALTRASIETKLKTLEDKSGIQLVVATVASLEGSDIETYANGLFRAWKLGDAKKNNGALFLIAPNERKVRIEVGYGLEGVLTDALAKVVIVTNVAPRFKAGDFGGGIDSGLDAIVSILSGDQSEWVKRAAPQDGPTLDDLMPFIILILFIFVFISMSRNARGGGPRGGYGGGGPIIFVPPSRGSSSGGGSSWGGGSWGGGDGGFTGGGGSSGGGGASGDW